MKKKEEFIEKTLTGAAEILQTSKSMEEASKYLQKRISTLSKKQLKEYYETTIIGVILKELEVFNRNQRIFKEINRLYEKGVDIYVNSDDIDEKNIVRMSTYKNCLDILKSKEI